MKKYLLPFLLLLLTSTASKADFNDGVVAYLTGDYDTAFNTMMSLADSTNDAMAQYWLGVMYLKGQGVEQNYEEAAKWLRLSAQQSIPNAQYKLAGLYSDGNGVPQDNEYAYIWYSVGASHQHEKSSQAIADAKAKLSSEELAEADKAIPEFIEKFGPKPEKDPNKPVQLDQ